jgi:membrane protein
MTFWLWVPLFLLRRRVSARALLPGALLASVVLGGMIAAAPLYLAPIVNQNGAAFGSLGVVLTMLGYVFVLITTSLVCAVFGPVWRDRRRWDHLTPAQHSA